MSSAPSQPDARAHPGESTEAEAFLQQRLVLLYKVMFFLAAGILLTNSVGIAKRPEERPGSVREFREALEAADDIPRWSQGEARAWWDQNRERLDTLRRTVPVAGSGRTVAVDPRARDS